MSSNDLSLCCTSLVRSWKASVSQAAAAHPACAGSRAETWGPKVQKRAKDGTTDELP